MKAQFAVRLCRELGFAIGLRAIVRAVASAEHTALDPRSRALAETLAGHEPLAGSIERFWREPDHRALASWCDHRDLGEVMLATSLAPRGTWLEPAA